MVEDMPIYARGVEGLLRIGDGEQKQIIR